MTTAITVLYDTIRWEEKALLEAGKKKNVDLQMLDCKKLSLDLDSKVKDYGTVLQRCVSYYRNLHSTAGLEGMGVNVINCLNTVYEITGQYDITAIISAPSINDINTCIDALRKIPGVIDSNSVIILRTLD